MAGTGFPATSNPIALVILDADIVPGAREVRPTI